METVRRGSCLGFVVQMLLVTAGLILPRAASAADFGAWSRKMPIVFSGYSKASTLTDFTALVVLGPHIAGFDYADFASPTGADLRFAAADLTTELDYEIEKWDVGGSSYVWVRVPSLSGTDTTIWAFWGNASVSAPTTTTGTWEPDYMGVWHLNATSGSLADSTANANTGARNGNTAATSGPVGNGQVFDGASNVMVPNDFSLDVAHITLEAWFKTSYADGGYNRIVDRRYSDGYILCQVGGTGGRVGTWMNGQSTQSSSTYADNVWRQMVATFNGSLMRLYINGEFVSSTSWSGSLPANGLPFAIGSNTGGGETFRGSVDEVRISNKARSADYVWAAWATIDQKATFAEYGPAESTSFAVIDTQTPTVPGATSATLNGYLSSTGASPTYVWAYLGTTDGSTNTDDWAQSFAFDGPQETGSVSTNVTVSGDTAYYCRFAASNANGFVWSPSSAFFISGAVTLEATDAAGSEIGPDSATFTVTRPNVGTNEALTISYTIGGTAANGTDYATLGTTVTIPAGSFAASVVVTPLADALPEEADETAVLTLATGGYVIGSPGGDTATITNKPPHYWYVRANGSDAAAGTNWVTAKQSIRAAMRRAENDDIIVVSNGTYTAAADGAYTPMVTVTNRITIRSVNGPAVTILDRQMLYFATAVSLPASAAGAVLDGFTITRGQYAGLGLAAGTVRNCIIRHNSGPDHGGGVIMSGGTLQNCLVVGNHEERGGGGGIYLSGGAVQNCTVVGNRAGGAGGGGIWMTGGTVSNSIVYHNIGMPNTPDRHNVYRQGGVFARSCATPLISGGANANNTAADPHFVNRGTGYGSPYSGYAAATSTHVLGDYRLRPGSPALDAGSIQDWMTDARDVAGQPRLNGTVDLGAYEADPAAGALRCGFGQSASAGLGSLANVIFTAAAAGSNTTGLVYTWDLGNGTLSGAEHAAVTRNYAAPGLYTVTLTVANGAGEVATCRVADAVAVHADVPTMYVAGSGTHQLPFDTPAKAATNLNDALTLAQQAIDLGASSLTRLEVGAGSFRLREYLTVTKALTLAGAGTGATTLDGNASWTVLYLNHASAAVEKLRVYSGKCVTYCVSGGAWLGAGTLRDCLLQSNVGNYETSSGLYMTGSSKAQRCTITGSSGGHAACWLDGSSQLLESQVLRNSDGNAIRISNGAGARPNSPKIRSCLIAANSGNGVYSYYGSTVLVESSTLVRNAGHGLRVDNGGAAVINSILYDNASGALSAPGYDVTYSCASGGATGSGNTASDPKFMVSGSGTGTGATLGDYRLQPTSPCVNTATTIAWHTGAKDLAGNARVAGGMPDMGAYEFFTGGTVLLLR